MFALIAHFWRRFTRTHVVEVMTSAWGGNLRRWNTEYIDHVDSDGRSVDVDLQQWVQEHWRRDWKCTPKNGGASVLLRKVKLKKAMALCAAQLGAVIHVDYKHGFIFYELESGKRAKASLDE